MTEPLTVAGALVFTGQDAARTEILAGAKAHLIAAGMHPLDTHDALADRQGLVVRAWWGGDELGFVSEDHPDAQPVTVVNVAPPTQGG